MISYQDEFDFDILTDIKLLQRTTRSDQVTQEGAAYYERASRWLRDLYDIESSFDRERVKPRGRIAIDVSAWAANAIVIPAYQAFMQISRISRSN